MFKGLPIIPAAIMATIETGTETRFLRVAATMLEAMASMVEGTITTVIHPEFLTRFREQCLRRKRMHITGRLDMILSQKPKKITTMVVSIWVPLPNLR